MSSPNVQTFERDRSLYVAGQNSSASAMVGLFRWGPVNKAIRITTDEKELLQKFGRPNNEVSQFFLSAANYLKYANPLFVVRAIDDLVAKNADSSGTGVLIKNESELETTDTTGKAFIAKYPGALGNSLKVSVADSFDYDSWQYAGEFEYAPDQGEFNVVVIDEGGLISGSKGAILERYELMTNVQGSKKPDGTSAFIEKVLLEQSEYIYLGDFDSVLLEETGSEGLYEASFSGGVDGNDSTAADFDTAIQVLSNKEKLDFISAFASVMPATSVASLIDLCDQRQDCKTHFAPELSDVLNNASALEDVKDYFNSTINKNTSYAFGSDNWKKVYDKYNDTNVWIPCDSDTAGLEARTFARNEPWFSFAGLNRGQLLNAIELAWNPDETTRNELYKYNINSIVDFEGEGKVLFGDKTMLKRPSAFSRVNVRNLFIVVKKSIARAARYQLFEFNDQITRSSFKNSSDRYLGGVQGRRGIRRFKVVADDTNNTEQVIDNFEFVGDIMIDPARSINNIRLNFTAVGAGVSFEEIEGESF